MGFETALSFARAGDQVFATMRNPDAATSLKEHIASEKLPIIIYKMDVDSDESVKQCIGKIMREHGTIDVLVNNAGIERHGSIEELTMADFKAVMETNYFGVIRCIQAVLPHMRQNKNGCIIIMGSTSGKMALSPLGAYAASKFAVEALSEALAIEVKPFNIRVALLEPGIINTQMADDISVDGVSIYPQSRRLAEIYKESLKQPTPAASVAETILGIANSSSWQLRYLVGPDAAPFLGWRASMTDEQWVDWNSQNDEDFCNAVKNTFGMTINL
ncbi:MAG: SDR family oxidoreductase [Ginsengibacter sp.]